MKALLLLLVLLVSPASAATFQWGLPGDVPIAGDFDGDGRPDLTVFRPSTGTWYVRLSSHAYALESAIRYQFGLPGDVPMAQDYDGDGLTDFAVWRSSTGTWHITHSGSRPQITEGFGEDATVIGSSLAFTVMTGTNWSNAGTVSLLAPMRCVVSMGPELLVLVGVRADGNGVQLYAEHKSEGFPPYTHLTVLCQP